jgi:trimethylamine--corrinoid protein Co-methyltransferase
LNLPLRCAGNFSNSKLPDAQAMNEGTMSMLSAVHCGANFILHSAGFLDGLLSMSYEKFVMDADFCGALHSYLAGVVVDDNTLALEAFREVGVGKHFLGCAHTMENYQTAFWDSSIADNEPFEKWDTWPGAPMPQAAPIKRWKQMLADYEAPPMDEATDEALVDYVERTKAAQADAWY